MNQATNAISAADIAEFADASDAWITGLGSLLKVTRPATTQDGDVTTRYVSFRPKPLKPQTAEDLMVEAGLNVNEGDPMDFVCAGNEDVAENDYVDYDGFQRRIFKISRYPLANRTYAKHCYAVRQRVSGS